MLAGVAAAVLAAGSVFRSRACAWWCAPGGFILQPDRRDKGTGERTKPVHNLVMTLSWGVMALLVKTLHLVAQGFV